MWTVARAGPYRARATVVLQKVTSARTLWGARADAFQALPIGARVGWRPSLDAGGDRSAACPALMPCVRLGVGGGRSLGTAWGCQGRLQHRRRLC